MKTIYFIFVVFILPSGLCGSEFKQERAKVVYVNPKYVKNLTIFTIRENRHAPYLTTMNATTLVPFSDNVTIRFEYTNSKLQAFPMRIDLKMCEGFKIKWSKEWLQTYSNIPLQCPMKPGTYHVTKFELPPKNFPFKFNNVDYSGRTSLFITGTKEKICDFTVELKSNLKS